MTKSANQMQFQIFKKDNYWQKKNFVITVVGILNKKLKHIRKRNYNINFVRNLIERPKHII